MFESRRGIKDDNFVLKEPHVTEYRCKQGGSGQRQPGPACFTLPMTSRMFWSTGIEKRSMTSLTSGLRVRSPPGYIRAGTGLFAEIVTLSETGTICSTISGGTPRVAARFCWGSPSIAGPVPLGQTGGQGVRQAWSSRRPPSRVMTTGSALP